MFHVQDRLERPMEVVGDESYLCIKLFWYGAALYFPGISFASESKPSASTRLIRLYRFCR
jgi:hypothetical protein